MGGQGCFGNNFHGHHGDLAGCYAVDFSSGLGGYLAGRLRTTWTGTHTHEVFFRDTANGLVTWAVATLVVTAVVASSVVSAIGGGVHSASNVASGAAHGALASEHAPGTGANGLWNRSFVPPVCIHDADRQRR